MNNYSEVEIKLKDLGYPIIRNVNTGGVTLSLEIEDWSVAARDVPDKLKDVIGEHFKVYYLPNIGKIIIEKK